MTRRPATAPMPVALIIDAATNGVNPRSRLWRTRWTSGMNTGIHDAVNAAHTSQNVRVRAACAIDHRSPRSPSRTGGRDAPSG